MVKLLSKPYLVNHNKGYLMWNLVNFNHMFFQLSQVPINMRIESIPPVATSHKYLQAARWSMRPLERDVITGDL
jgi:hypothetical protein